MKHLILILIIVASNHFAFAQGTNVTPSGVSYCIEDIYSATDYFSQEDFEWSMYALLSNPYADHMHKARLTCSEKKGWDTSLEVVSISMTSVALMSLAYAPATGGTTLWVTLGSGITAIGSSMVKIVLGAVPCEDTMGVREREEEVKRIICEIAGRKGSPCDIRKINIEYKEDMEIKSNMRSI